MPNLKEFILETLIDGVKNKIFAKEYANILAINYMTLGYLKMEDIEEYKQALIEPIVEESIDEPIIEAPGQEELVTEEPVAKIDEEAKQ